MRCSSSVMAILISLALLSCAAADSSSSSAKIDPGAPEQAAPQAARPAEGQAEHQGTKPELPRALIDTAYAPPKGRTISVAAGGDLQAAINEARPGDVVSLQAGATFTGNFVLPKKSGSEWIIIRSSAADARLPRAGERITPQFADALAKVITPNSNPALRTEPGAHHFRVIGIEFGISEGVKANFGIVALGDGGPSQSALDQVPHDLVIDRCYIHGNNAGNARRGVALNSARTAIIDSYISNIHEVGADSQAILGWNGPGPFKIVNNYLEASGENVMFGGVDPKIADLVPSDIEFRRNHCFKPLAWRMGDPGFAGTRWTVKNLFELKNAQRVLISGNVFEQNWRDAQDGMAILFTPRNQTGTAPWTVVQDVTFINNIVRRAPGAVSILGRDTNFESRQTKRIEISNNLFEDIDGQRWAGQPNGRFLMIAEALNVKVEHNTVIHNGNIITAYRGPSPGFVFTNNISFHNKWGIAGDSAGSGLSAINRYFPDGRFAHNALVGAQRSSYPKNNLFPATVDEVGFVDLAGGDYRLSPSSPLRAAGSQSARIGCDIDKLRAETGGVATASSARDSATLRRAR